MSLKRQPLLGDVLHIKTFSTDFHARIVKINDRELIVRGMSGPLILTWNGREWILMDTFRNNPELAKISLIDRNLILPRINDPKQNPMHLSTTVVDRSNLSREQDSLRKDLKYFDDKTIDFLNHNEDPRNISYTVQEEMQRRRNADEEERELILAHRIARRPIWDSNPYLSQMSPQNPQKSNAYPDNRPGIITNPNFDSKKFRLPNPKL